MTRGWHGDSAGHARAAKKGHRRKGLVGKTLAKGSKYGTITARDTRAVSIAGKIYALKRSGQWRKGPSTIMSVPKIKRK